MVVEFLCRRVRGPTDITLMFGLSVVISHVHLKVTLILQRLPTDGTFARLRLRPNMEAFGYLVRSHLVVFHVVLPFHMVVKGLATALPVTCYQVTKINVGFTRLKCIILSLLFPYEEFRHKSHVKQCRSRLDCQEELSIQSEYCFSSPYLLYRGFLNLKR